MIEVIEIIRKLMTERNKPLLVVIDGRSGSGKTVLTEKIGKQFGATIILGDNFYSGGSFQDWEKKSIQEKIDGCIDWKRMRVEVLEPLLSGKVARWSTCNWETLLGLSKDKITSVPSAVIILDGAYSNRPELKDLIDLSFLVEIDDKVRRERLLKREGSDFMKQWHSVWDEAEDYYFSKVSPPSSFNVVINALDI